MKKRNPYLTVGLVMTGILTALIVLGFFWTPYDPNAMAAGPKLTGPSLAHLMGTDSFGHKMLAGCGKYLENLVRSRLGVKARSVELNVSQRCSASLLSATDQQEAVSAGRFGVQSALKGETGKMVSFVRKEGPNGEYQMECGLEDVNAICNMEKTVPLEWIIADGSDVNEDFVNYARPLIQGKVDVPLGSDGLPCVVYRK